MQQPMSSAAAGEGLLEGATTPRESYMESMAPHVRVSVTNEGEDPRVKHHFPQKVFPAELREILDRRATLPRPDPVSAGVHAVACNSNGVHPTADLGLVGLALSGGGLRSATFNLGVLQAMLEQESVGPGGEDTRRKPCLFQHMDFLSTVSGGTYIGSCLTTLLEGQESLPLQQCVPEDPAVRHLRCHSRPHSVAAFAFSWFCGEVMIALTVFPLTVLLIKLLLLLTFLKHVVANELFGKDCYTAALMSDHCDWQFQRCYSVTVFFLAGMALTVIVVAMSAKLRRLIKRPRLLDRDDCDDQPKTRLTRFAVSLQAAPSGWHVWRTLGVIALLAAWAETVDSVQYMCQQFSPSLLSVCGVLLPLVFCSAAIGISLGNANRSWVRTLRDLSALLSVTCLFFLLQVAHYGLEREVFGFPLLYQDITQSSSLIKELVAVSVVYLCMEISLNVNEMSLNNIYKDKLQKAYLIQLDQDADPSEPFTPGGACDRSTAELSVSDLDRILSSPPRSVLRQSTLRLSQLNTRQKHSPFFIINAAVDLQTKASDGSLIDRTADFFSFTKLFVGSRRLGYIRTEVMETTQPDLDLGTATSISGAALGQALIGTRQSLLEFLMAMLNVRMGYWCINPRWVRRVQREAKTASCWHRFKMLISRHYFGPALFFRELLGMTSSSSAHVHLTDGGHIEDLGLHELLQRRCKFIVLSDATSEDSGPRQYFFNRLATALRLARTTQGIHVALDLTKLQCDPETGYTQRHYTVGVIHYPARPEVGLEKQYGYLLLVKLCMTGLERLVDVGNVRANNARFPNDPTSNQFFHEAQFEAYRALGHHVMASICVDARRYLPRVEQMESTDDTCLSEDPQRDLTVDLIHSRNTVMSRWFSALLLCCREDGDRVLGTSVDIRRSRTTHQAKVS